MCAHLFAKIQPISPQVASSDEGFGTTSTDAVYHYHSIYDSQHWQEEYGDVGFHRHVSHGTIPCSSHLTQAQVAIAKHLGLVGLRLTDSIILPLNTTQYTIELGHYLDKYAWCLTSAITS